MKDKISKKAKIFRRNISPVREIMNFADPKYIKSLGLNPDELISFAGGWVNHDAPNELRDAYLEIANDVSLFHESGSYSPTLGRVDFKEAIIKFEKELYGMIDLSIDQISVGLGSTQQTMDLFEVLLDPMDKILLLDPSYCNFPTQVITGIRDIEIIRFPVLDEEDWKVKTDEKKDLFYDFVIENKPKVILLISPDNPTSKVLSDDFVKTAYSAVKEIGSFLLMDFAYKEIIFNEKYPDYFSWGPKDNFISIRSNSKWCRGLGRRLGWIEAPEFVIEAMESIQNSTILCPDTLSQMALTRYIEKSIENKTLKNYVRETSALYERAAKLTFQSIKDNLPFPALHSEGGLYTCMRIDDDGAKFVEEVLRGCGVLLVPGRGFGNSLKNSVRISYGPLVNNLDKIQLGFEKIRNYINNV